MKKVLAVLMAVSALGLVVSGCSKSDDAGTTAPATTGTTGASTPTTGTPPATTAGTAGTAGTTG